MGNAVIEAQGGVVEKFEDEPITSAAPKRERPAYRPRETVKETVEQPVTEPVVEKAVVVEEVKAEEVVVEAVAPAPVSLEAMTVADLRALAKERGITGFSTLKKADLIDLLK